MPVVAANEPAAHCAHADNMAVAPIVPAAQFAHADWPAADAYVPTVQVCTLPLTA